jgi:Leucine-rich repeat (LRR) protein
MESVELLGKRYGARTSYLKLQDPSLTEIPPEIYQFKNLQSLKINGTLISEIPNRIIDLPLSYLNLQGNQITEFPSRELFKQMLSRGLSDLRLGDNLIQSIPGEIIELIDVYNSDENQHIYVDVLKYLHDKALDSTADTTRQPNLSLIQISTLSGQTRNGPEWAGMGRNGPEWVGKIDGFKQG